MPRLATRVLLLAVLAACHDAPIYLPVPGAPTRLVRTAGDGQTAGIGVPFPLALRVTAQDSAGVGVPNVQVSWAVISGNGSVNPATSFTNDQGVAQTVYTAGAAGPATVSASSPGLTGSPVLFSEQAGSSGGGATITLVKEMPVVANYGLHDQFIRGGLAFLCIWNEGLQIFDVGGGTLGGSPADPRLIGRVVTAGGKVHNAWWYWAPNGDKKYVFVGEEGPGTIGGSSSGNIHVVDVSNMASPVEVASFALPGAGTHNFWVDEQAEILYAAYYNGGVVALNVSGTLSGDLASRMIANVQPGGAGNTFVWGVQLYNGSLYATDMLSGFWQLNPGSLQPRGGGTNVPDRYGSDQWLANGYAYSGTWGGPRAGGQRGNALKIWQLNATGAPVLVDSIITAGVGTVSDVEVSGDNKLLMFSAENGTGAGIYFYSLVPNPSHPAFLAVYPVATGVHTATFAQIGGRRYVFAAKDPSLPSLLVLDVTPIGP